jgi:hypothetical protein
MLNTLLNALNKKGLNYVNNLLSENVIITEKLDTYRVLFENVNGKLTFFKKDNTPINLIERVLTNIWEDAIIELSIILSEHELPLGLRFGLAYTPNEKPIRLVYNKIPKYILTDVSKRDEKNNKVIESFDYNKITEWAAEFNLGGPPIIFDGKLNEKQKENIIKYVSGNYDNIDKLEDIFEKKYSKAEIIEGIIIKTDTELYQVESYEFNILNEAYQRVETSRDFYDLTILEINSFMESYQFPLVLEGVNSDDLYLEIICDIFNKYNAKEKVYEDLDPNYLVPPSYGDNGDLNLLLLKNKKTLSILENGNNIHKSLFKIMLSSFRKYKKPFGLLKECDTEKFNTYTYLINEKSSGKPLGNLPEVQLLLEFSSANDITVQEYNSENIVVRELDQKLENNDIDNMRVIASVQKSFKLNTPKIKKSENKCIVYIVDPEPITISHQENLQNLYNIWKLPIIVAFVKSDNRVNGKKFHMSDDLKKAQVMAFANANHNICPAFFLMNTWSLTEIFNFCRPKYEPIALVVDNNKKSEFVLQLYFEEKIMGGRINVEPDFNIADTENKELLQSYRSIEDNNSVKFNNLTPSCIWGLLPKMVSEFKTWNGETPMQFTPNKF